MRFRLYLRWSFCREFIIWLCFQMSSAKLYILIHVFRPSHLRQLYIYQGLSLLFYLLFFFSSLSVFFCCLLWVTWTFFRKQFWFIYNVFELIFCIVFFSDCFRCYLKYIYHHNLLMLTFYEFEWIYRDLAPFTSFCLPSLII